MENKNQHILAFPEAYDWTERLAAFEQEVKRRFRKKVVTTLLISSTAISAGFGYIELAQKFEELDRKNQQLNRENQELIRSENGLINQNKQLETYNPYNQVFETFIHESGRGYDPIVNYSYRASQAGVENTLVIADTVAFFVGFNPHGLHCKYLSRDPGDSLSYSSYGEAVHSGLNSVIFHTVIPLGKKDMNSPEVKELVEQAKNHNADKDSLQFYYSVEDDNNEIRDVPVHTAPVGMDMSEAMHINPQKPVLVCLTSMTKQTHRNGIRSFESILENNKKIYGAENVIVVNDPNQQKMERLAELMHQNYPNTRFDFSTNFEHHGDIRGGVFCTKVTEARIKSLWGQGNAPSYGGPEINEIDIVSMIEKFPGKLNEKRLFITECDVNLKNSNSFLRKLGMVVSPAPKGLYNVEADEGEYGKEAIQNMRDFDVSEPVAPQVAAMKEVLKKTYDDPAMQLLQQYDPFEVGTSQAQKILSDPSNQIYINSMFIMPYQKETFGQKIPASNKSPSLNAGNKHNPI